MVVVDGGDCVNGWLMVVSNNKVRWGGFGGVSSVEGGEGALKECASV